MKNNRKTFLTTKKKLFYILFFLIIVISSILIVSCNDSGEPSGSPMETLDAPTNINIDKRILTWNAVENATGYSINFNNEEYETTEPTFDLHFHGDGGEYDIRVKAIGDGKNCWNSEWSEIVTFTLSERVAVGYDETGCKYTLLEDESGYELTDATGSSALTGVFTVPDYFGDYPVKRVGISAFCYSTKDMAPNCFTEALCNKWTTGLKLPEHLESIGIHAFSCMIKLEEIVIPDSVTEIGDSAFEGCKSLTRAVLPKNLKVIPTGCFKNTALSGITLPEALESIERFAFQCTYEEHTFGSTTEQIGSTIVNTHNRVMCHISSDFSSISFPSSVKSIGEKAFWGRENLRSIILSNTVEEFGEQVFHNTKWYNEHPDGMMFLGIGECFLYEYKGEIPGGGVIDNLPSNVKGICPYAFRGTNLTKIVIPNGVKLVGEHALACANDLIEAVLPSDWETIKSNTFQGTVSLKNIKLPANISRIESGAFSNSAIEAIIIPETVTVIEKTTFYGCENLTEVILPSTLTRIEKYAFSGTKSLKSIVLPNSLTYIGEGAFTRSGIEKITVPKNVKTIDDNAFSGCKTLTEINLPEGLTSIGDYAFNNCAVLKEIVLPESLRSIGNNAFTNCTALKEIVLPASLESIGSPIIGFRATVFKGCEALTHIYYEGNRAKWASITTDVDIPSELVYTYYETQPANEGKYWHYVDGKITVWTYE